MFISRVAQPILSLTLFCLASCSARHLTTPPSRTVRIAQPSAVLPDAPSVPPAPAGSPSSPLAGRLTVSEFVNAFRSIEVANSARARSWARAGSGSSYAEGACHYLAATVAGTWLIELTLREKQIRAARFTDVTAHPLHPFCDEAVPYTELNASEWIQPVALSQELSVTAAADLETLSHIDSQVTQGMATYFQNIRGVYRDFCSTASTNFEKRVRLEVGLSLIEQTWQESVAPLLQQPAFADLPLRASEVLWSAATILEALHADQLAVRTRPIPQDDVVAGATLAGLSVVSGIVALALPPVGIPLLATSLVGMVITPSGINTERHGSQAAAATDALYKVKGVSDLLVKAVFDGVSISGSAVQTTPTGVLATEVPPIAAALRQSYRHFGTWLIRLEPDSGISNFSRERSVQTRAFSNFIDGVAAQRLTLCDRYPAEWSHTAACRGLHRLRCDAALRAHYSH